MTVMRKMRPWGHLPAFTWGLPWTTLAVAVHPTPDSNGLLGRLSFAEF
jgi:hypothetical protein